jgi:hypothetical protein
MGLEDMIGEHGICHIKFDVGQKRIKLIEIWRVVLERRYYAFCTVI